MELTKPNLGTCMIITTHEIKSTLHFKVFFLGYSSVLLSPLHIHLLTLILCNLITYIQKKNLKLHLRRDLDDKRNTPRN